MSQQDQAFLTIFKAVIGFLIGLTIVIIIVARLIGEAVQQKPEASEVTKRIRPVGEVYVGKAPEAPKPEAPRAEAPPEKVALTGQQVYQQTCFACHGTGAAGAPKLGDKAAWEPRIAQGMDTLVEHALKGFKAMPPKGGNPGLSDKQVADAVAYMVEKSR